MPATGPADAWVRNRLLAGTALLFVGRLTVSLTRSGPLVVADEIGYLTNARVLAGGLHGQLQHAPYYRGGYSLLLSPLLGLSSSPSVAYHSTLILGAALSASLVWLLYLLLTRCAAVAARVAVWAALAGALYPSITVFSQVALSENLLFPLTCVWLLFGDGFATARTPRNAVIAAAGFGGSGAALWAVHGRMIAAVALTVVLTVWLGARRPKRRAAAVAALAALAVGVGGAHLLNSFLVAHNYGGHAANEANNRISALGGVRPVLTALSNLAGQLWYLVVSTFGLAAVVLARVLPARGRGSGGECSRGRGVVYPLLLALTALLLLVSAGSFPTRTRPDMLIYGRYVEVVAPPLIALGLALVTERGLGFPARPALLAIGATTAIVVLVRVAAPDPGLASRWNVASLPFLTFQLGAAVILGATAVSVAGACLLSRRPITERLTPGVVALALFLPVTAYGELNPVIQSQRSAYPSGWTSPGTVAAAARIRVVAYDLAHYDVIGLYVPQWFLPDTREVLFDSRRGRAPARYVISGRRWASTSPARRVALWRYYGRDQVLSGPPRRSGR